MFISGRELQELTQRIQSDAQARELDALGIPYRRRRDRSLVVLRATVEAVLGIVPAGKVNGEPRLRF